MPPEKELNVDNVLSELGNVGKFQLINFVLIGIAILLSSIVSLTFVFAAGEVNYRCRIPGCDDNQTEYKPDWLSHAVPHINGVPSRCTRYNSSITDSSQCWDENAFEAYELVVCNDWVFETEERTILNEFGLTCPENDWKLAFVGTINNAALFVFIAVMGGLSDRFGRRTMVIYGLFFTGVFGLIKSFSVNYVMYVIFEFLEAGASSGVYATAFILAVELMQPSQRVLGGTIIACNYTLGEIVLGIIAMLVPNYRTLLHITYAPLLLIISYFWLIPESVRWLFVKGKTDEAVSVIRKAAKMNKIILSDQTMDKLRCAEHINVLNQQHHHHEINKRYAIVEVFKSRILLIRLANCCLCWITNAFVYYGLSLNSVTLAGDKYVNFILVCTAEIPGYIITVFVLNKFGRKYSLCASMLLCGVACLSSEYIPVGQSALRLIMFLIGKCSITVSFTVLYVFTTEMYPTNLRNSLVCACSMIGRIGSMAAPQTPLLGKYMAALPLILFGSLSIISGLLGLLFPETLNTMLPDTVEEAENIGKNVPKG
ncbi:hypothetical protein HA402_006250 [Bradysia odoriphaga]|nr:hypothetical protein HA402_006250 [Bradysia odoriphaga]